MNLSPSLENHEVSRACDADRVVLKFGSSVLQREEDLSTAVHAIYAEVRRGARVVAVVSAIGDTTDRLLATSTAVGGGVDGAGLARWLATGESASAALLGLALERAGIPFAVFDAREAGLRTRGSVLDAEPVALDREAFLAALSGDEACDVVVVPGFAGIDETTGEPTLLGRGGSDLTALFVAEQLGARCTLHKDVDGVYATDPHVDPESRRYATLTYAKAREVAGVLVQPKSIDFAERAGMPIDVTAFGAPRATRIGARDTVFDTTRGSDRALRVGLLGLGAVGGGVYARLAALPQAFDIVRVVVRDPGRARDTSVPTELLCTSSEEAVDDGCDVLVDVRSASESAADVLERALVRGVSIVTADKQLVAEHGPRLVELGARSGARFYASACVGGGVPMFEAAQRLARPLSQGRRVVGFEGVLNGTMNWLLDQWSEGASYEASLERARALGFAEDDPWRDLSGLDAWDKARILARVLFAIDPGHLPDRLQAVGRRDAGMIAGRSGACDESVERVVTSVDFDAEHGTLRGAVALRTVARRSVFGSTRGERNAVRFEHADGTSTVVRGRGAGRWPTTEAVIADLFDELRRVRSGTREEVRP